MANNTVRVDALAMQGIAASLGGAAEHLQAQLADLDDQVEHVLGGWRGASGSAYGSAWELWHRGAGEVRAGLSILGRLLNDAASSYRSHDAGSAQAEQAVRGG